VRNEDSAVDWIHLRWIFLYLLPAIPVAVAWRESILSVSARGLLNLAPQTASTISLLWIAAALINQSVLGPGYSNIRYGIILGNLIVVASTFLFSVSSIFFAKVKIQSIWTGIACLLLFVDWTLTAASNAVA
jgi:hypothetical protein